MIYVYVGAAAFILRFILAFFDPAFSYGRSFGLWGFVIVVGIMAVSIAAAGLFWWVVAPRLLKPRAAIWAFAFLTFVSSFFTNYGLSMAADSDWELGKYLAGRQIEYFCLSNFNRESCVTAVNSCPQCALEIERWKRDKMTEKLKAFRGQYPAQVPRQPAAK